jgi:ATP-binding protein involved in chromosome partitioning
VWRPAVGDPRDAGLQAEVAQAVRGIDGVHDVDVCPQPMDDARRGALAQRLRAAQRRPGGLGDHTAVYAVGSGKGGVGKSTLTANLAVALADQGRRVGVLDADVWGYSMPQLLGVREAPVAVKGIMLPVTAHGIALMSIGFFGTGDVTLSVVELLPDAAVVVATTPQTAAEQVAARVGRMARDARMPLAGVVENMSGTVCAHCGETTAAFGEGGGSRLAQSLDAPLLGRIPLDPALCAAGDAGTPLVRTRPESAAAQALTGVARRLPAVRRSIVGRSLPLFVG